MTSTLDTAPPPPPEGPEGPPAKPSSFDRIIGVLMAPSETFESIAARPNWGVPLIIILVIAVVSGVLVATRVNFNDLAREAMEMNPNVSQIPADRVDSMIKVSGAMMKISAYASPFLLTILFVVVAGVLLVSSVCSAAASRFCRPSRQRSTPGFRA